MTNHAEAAALPAQWTRVGLGGWLTLPAIAFVVSPILGVGFFIAALGYYSDVASAGYAGVFTLELLVQAGMLVFLIYTAKQFFGKKATAPSTIIALLVVSLVSTLLLLVIEVAADAETFALESGKQLVRCVIQAAIWIPYFKASKRVKATFVH